jgi:hypothetical protein
MIAVCDGLKGLPDAIGATWELAQVQTCIINLIRNTFRYAARQHWEKMAKDLRPIYTAVNAEQAAARPDDCEGRWASICPAAVKLWRNAWAEFIPLLDYDVEIHKIICTTQAIESLNARYRRAVRARGHFPNDQAARKWLHLVTRSLDPTGIGRARWLIRWKAALNAFAITFEGRINPSDSEDASGQLHRKSDSPVRGSHVGPRLLRHGHQSGPDTDAAGSASTSCRGSQRHGADGPGDSHEPPGPSEGWNSEVRALEC